MTSEPEPSPGEQRVADALAALGLTATVTRHGRVSSLGRPPQPAASRPIA